MRGFILFLWFIGIAFPNEAPYIVVLGIAQDGGSPHAGCKKACCTDLWNTKKKEKVSCIGIVDPRSGKSWMIDATPDFPEQHRILTQDHQTELAGIFFNTRSYGTLHRITPPWQGSYGR